jgi:hypothetical protein
MIAMADIVKVSLRTWRDDRKEDAATAKSG